MNRNCLLSVLIVLGLLVAGSQSIAQGTFATNIPLDEIDGSRTNLRDYLRIGPVYINFWALWCEPCKQELRALKSFAKEGETQPFTILAVNLDSPRSLAKVKAYVKSQSYPFPVVLDPNMQIFKDFNGQNLPFAVLIDKNGKLVSIRTGYFPGDEEEIKKEIMKLVTR